MKPSDSRSDLRKTGFRQFLVIGSVFICLLVPALGMGAGDAGHGDGENGAKGWVATDTYRVMNFVVLAVGLFILLKKPISNALRSRITGIQDQLRDLELKKKKAEAELAEYNERLSLLDKEAERIVQEYIEQGKAAKEKILKEAETAAQKLEEQAKRNIEHEFKQAKEKLQTEIFEKALAQAESLLREGITPEDQDRLVEDYLNKVVAR